MGVSLNWLKKYVDIDWSPEQLAHGLTMAGIAIEGVEKASNDVILELDLTPNRGDCMGLINLAREVAAISGKRVKMPEISIKENTENIDDYIKVEIEAPDLCRRYTARLITNCVIKPSPQWMQEALLNSGIRPINNIVDITNYVMLETNQPLHAFDYDLLGKDKRINVRRARPGEKMTTLDEVERKLDGDMLLITESNRPVALAGIMGGLNTEINDRTTRVLLESANFLGTNIRKTSRKLALRSESSSRFEKGVDINGATCAIDRAAQLLQELAGGEVVRGICDIYPVKQYPLQVELRPERINYLLGTNISVNEVKALLDKLAFKYREKDGVLMVGIPTYRPDIEMEVDLIEEIARLYGYDRIPDRLPHGVNRGGLNRYQKFKQKVTGVMSRNLNEVINYSFITPRVYEQLLLPAESDLRNTVKIANPLSEEQSVMRTMLLPGLLQNICSNLSRRNKSLALFEIGSVFFPSGGRLPVEKLKLGAITVGSTEVNWLKHSVEMDFFYLKGIVEYLLKELGISDPKFIPFQSYPYHPGKTAQIKFGSQVAGIIGELHPLVLDNFGIKEKVCAFELDLDLLYNLKSDKVKVKEITKYPAVERDIAVLLKENSRSADVIKLIKQAAPDFLEDIIVFDVYSGNQVPEDYKSMAFRLIFQLQQRTLREEEVNEAVENIINELVNEMQAVLR